MTCLAPALDGTVVDTQNRLGPREADVLRMTDWFFPNGINHHELLAGVPALESMMQVFARNVAGLGHLPSAPAAVQPAERRETDVLVIGAGPSAMASATAIAASGSNLAITVIDDRSEPGGSLLALGDHERGAFKTMHDAFLHHARAARITLSLSSVAVGIYGRDVLVITPTGPTLFSPKALVLACGAHDGVRPFEGNDVPGVMSARAAGWFLAHGVAVGANVLVVTTPSSGRFGISFERAFNTLASTSKPLAGSPAHAKASTRKARLVVGEPVRVRGSSCVRGVVWRDAHGVEHKSEADALVIDAPRSAAYELAIQAGGTAELTPLGNYVVRATDHRIAHHVYAVGELTGTPLDVTAMTTQAAHVANQIATQIKEPLAAPP